MNGNPGVELRLRPDFAARVLAAAHRLEMRRRRLRQVSGAFALCAGIATVAVWLDFSAALQGPATGRNPVFVSASMPIVYQEAVVPAERDGSSDALSWFFPDAQPLARYAAEDAPDDSGNSAGALFADDE